MERILNGDPSARDLNKDWLTGSDGNETFCGGKLFGGKSSQAMIPKGQGPGGEQRLEETPKAPDLSQSNGHRTLIFLVCGRGKEFDAERAMANPVWS